MPNCLTCGAGIDEYDSGYYSRSMLCIPCYASKSSDTSVSCTRCGTRVRREEASRRGGSVYCYYCASELERVERKPACPLCGNKMESWQKSIQMANGQPAHSECAQARQGPRGGAAAFCSSCGRQAGDFRVLPGGRAICRKCDREGAAASRNRNRTVMSSLMDSIGAMLG